MTIEEIRKLLDNTKVYVNGKSKEIQEKLFSFGYKWNVTNSCIVCNTREPFLFINKNEGIQYENNMNFFNEHRYREITADEILSLEVTEPSYRPFKTEEECWQEMLKHQPFGWIKLAFRGGYLNLVSRCPQDDFNAEFKKYTFADGTPFGIKEE